MTCDSAEVRVRGLLAAWRREIDSVPIPAVLDVPVLRRRWLTVAERTSQGHGRPG